MILWKPVGWTPSQTNQRKTSANIPETFGQLDGNLTKISCRRFRDKKTCITLDEWKARTSAPFRSKMAPKGKAFTSGLSRKDGQSNRHNFPVKLRCSQGSFRNGCSKTAASSTWLVTLAIQSFLVQLPQFLVSSPRIYSAWSQTEPQQWILNVLLCRRVSDRHFYRVTKPVRPTNCACCHQSNHWGAHHHPSHLASPHKRTQKPVILRLKKTGHHKPNHVTSPITTNVSH